jgi:hypothetical protein
MKGTAAMTTTDDDGIEIAGLRFDAGPSESPVLLELGPEGSRARHAKDPITLHDVFFRVGACWRGIRGAGNVRELRNPQGWGTQQPSGSIRLGDGPRLDELRWLELRGSPKLMLLHEPRGEHDQFASDEEQTKNGLIVLGEPSRKIDIEVRGLAAGKSGSQV